MFRINHNYTLLPGSYLFSEIARRVADFQAAHPDAEIIKMGIGDVTRPLCPAVVDALHQAVEEEAAAETFRGYGPEQGYPELRALIARTDYRERGIDIDADEIFVSDGAKSDTGNITDILAADSRIAVTDPVYPVYVDTNVMGGRGGMLNADGRWSRITYLPCTEENGFCPALPATRPDVVYLCYPNNPTGTVLSREELTKWVDYCRREGVLLLFDAAYEAFVRTPGVPRSIYEIEGARETAIEFRSFSKTAGFTGIRLGYTVVPKELTGVDACGNKVGLHGLWKRRQTTKFNGASFLTQRAGEALYSPEGQQQVKEGIDFYLSNAATIREGLDSIGLRHVGGTDSPYIWVKAPEGMTSWEFFNLLLEKYHIVCTPGSGFGKAGEGYVRLTAFNSAERVAEAIKRLKSHSL